MNHTDQGENGSAIIKQKERTERKVADHLLKARDVREHFGGISSVTLWRWERDGVIPPSVIIRRRKYWRQSQVEELKAPSAGGAL